jgi:hypothetical protein
MRLRRGGVVCVAVRRAILSEQVATKFATDSRTAWRIHHDESTGELPVVRLQSMNKLVEEGWEPERADTCPFAGLGPSLSVLVDALVEVGWPYAVVSDAVLFIADTSGREGTTDRVMVGARRNAHALRLPVWQVRRLMYVVLGAPGWPGVVRRLVEVGPGCLDDPGVRAAMKSTMNRHHLAPILAASRAVAHAGEVDERHQFDVVLAKLTG